MLPRPGMAVLFAAAVGHKPPEKLFTQEEDHMAHVNALQRSIAAAASFWRERQIPFDCVLNLFE